MLLLLATAAIATTATTLAAAASGACPSPNPCVRQVREQAWGDDNPADHALSFAQPLLAGSTVLVFTTDININGTPVGTGAPSPIVISDSAAGTYRALVTVNNHWDWDAVRVFARTNVPAGALAVRTVWQTNQWHGLMIAEVAGAPANPRITAIGANNFDAAQTTDATSSGLLELGQAPALLVGFAFNASASAGDQGAPLAGSGFTSIGTAWNWNGKEGTPLKPVALLEAAQLSPPGRVAATFTPTPSVPPDDYMVVAVALQGTTPSTPAAAPASPAWATLLAALALLGIFMRRQRVAKDLCGT